MKKVESKTMLKKFFMLLLLLTSVAFYACKEEDNPANNDNGPNSDIPADPGGSAPATTINNVRPAATFAKTAGNESRIRISLLGIINPATGQPIEFSGNQNIYVTEDNTLKGIKLTRVSANNSLGVDIVFTVDNSGSMLEEADSIASKILAFANVLQTSGLNVRFGCVGYNGPVTGAIDLTVAESLRVYLNRATGTSRTVGFGGANAQALQQAAQGQNAGVSGENGIVAIRYADSLFAWRQSAQRIYINFTDEPTQPNGRVWYSTNGFLDSWNIQRGTIHTVWSGGDTTWQESLLFNEKPWRLSIGTGGTIKLIQGNARDLDLTNLPVTVALQNSWLVEFRSANPNVPHTVRITVKTNGADGETRYENVSY